MPAEQYPDDWDERRKKVYQRDDYECQLCHAQGGQAGDTELHAHHVTPISEGGSHDLDNLTTLCKSCHNDQHDHDITAGDQQPSTSTSSGAGATVVVVLLGLVTSYVVAVLYYGVVGAFLTTGAEYGIIEFLVALIVCSGLAWAAGRIVPRSTLGYAYLSFGLVSVYQYLSADGGIKTVWKALRMYDKGAVFSPLVVDLSLVAMLVIPVISRLSKDEGE